MTAASSAENDTNSASVRFRGVLVIRDTSHLPVGPFLNGQHSSNVGFSLFAGLGRRSGGIVDASSGLSDINLVEIADLVRPDTDCVEGCAAPSLSLQDGGRMVLSRPLAWRRERRGSSTMHPHGCCWSSTLTHEDVQGCSGTFHPYAS